MYEVGSTFNAAAQGSNRQIMIRATFDDSVIVYGEHIQRAVIQPCICPDKGLTLGNACSAQLTLEMIRPPTLTPSDLKQAKIFVEMGFLGVTNALNAVDTQLYVNEILGYLYQRANNGNLTFTLTDGELVASAADSGVTVRLRDGKVIAKPAEGVDIATATFWLPMGVYYSDKVTTINDYTTATITAFDGMVLLDRLDKISPYYPSFPNVLKTAKEWITVLGNEIGVNTVFPLGLANSTDKLRSDNGFYRESRREMLGYFAGFLGANAIFDRTGQLTVKMFKSADYTIDRSQQYLAGLKRNADDSETVTHVVCTTPESDSDLTIIPDLSGFTAGFINASTGEINPGAVNGMPFYAYDELPWLDATYTISRDNAEGFADLFFYSWPWLYIGTNSAKCSFTGNHPLDSGQKSNSFTIINTLPVNTEPDIVCFQVTSGRYRSYSTQDRNTGAVSTSYEIDTKYSVKRYRGDNNTLISSGSHSGAALSLSNPFIYKQALVDAINYKYATVPALSYLPCDIKYRGNPALDVGDIVKAEDKNGNLCNVVILSQVITIGGGMNIELKCGTKEESQ